MSGALALLWQKDGTAVAYEEGDGCSELTEDQEEVLKARLSYDRLRDLALSPPESLAFIRGVVPVRDSKRPQGPALVFGGGAWAAFVGDVREPR